jgi:hypothetical protein
MSELKERPSDSKTGIKVVGFEVAGALICMTCTTADQREQGEAVTLGFGGACSVCGRDTDAELGPPDGEAIPAAELESNLRHSVHANSPVIDPQGVAAAEVDQHMEDLHQLQRAELEKAEMWGRKLLMFLVDHHGEVHELYKEINQLLAGRSPVVATLALILLSADGADQIPAPRTAIPVVLQGLELGKGSHDGTTH